MYVTYRVLLSDGETAVVEAAPVEAAAVEAASSGMWYQWK